MEIIETIRRMTNQKMTNQNQSGLTVVMISAACCMPGMAAFDNRAQRIIEQAISETGVDAHLKIIPATNAFFSGALRKVLEELMAMSNQDKIGVPAVLINGEVVSYGVPTLEVMKAALYKFNKTKGESKNE